MNFYKKLLLLLVSTHMALSNSNKSYFTLKDINPVHFGATFASAFLLGAYCMKKFYDVPVKEAIKNIDNPQKNDSIIEELTERNNQYRSFFQILNLKKAAIVIHKDYGISFASYSYFLDNPTTVENDKLSYEIKFETDDLGRKVESIIENRKNTIQEYEAKVHKYENLLSDFQACNVSIFLFGARRDFSNNTLEFLEEIVTESNELGRMYKIKEIK